jgi:methionyl-tRNA formyltransferase
MCITTLSNMRESTTATSVAALPRVLFLGTYGAFSRTVLDALITAGAPVCGLLMVTYPRQRPIVQQRHPPQAVLGDELYLYTPGGLPNTVELAWRHQIPVYEVGRIGSPATRKLVKSLAPEVACVACFSHKIPPTLLRVPKQGFLNVHPSKLPAYRGPDPIFWQLQAGVDPFTVTVHWMDADWDSGDIAAQAPLVLSDGIERDEIEQRCAEVGGQLVVEVLQALAQGQPPRTPQSAESSYQSWPNPDDFAIEPTWSARRAFNFMRGTADRRALYPVKIGAEEFYLTKALAVFPDKRINVPYHRDAETFFLQCSPGILCAEALR